MGLLYVSLLSPIPSSCGNFGSPYQYHTIFEVKSLAHVRTMECLKIRNTENTSIHLPGQGLWKVFYRWQGGPLFLEVSRDFFFKHVGNPHFIRCGIYHVHIHRVHGWMMDDGRTDGWIDRLIKSTSKFVLVFVYTQKCKDWTHTNTWASSAVDIHQ